MKILITCGSTWVKIDEVRILTNIFSGKTGVYIAKELKKKKHSVTLFLNPHCFEKRPKNLKVITFKYYEDFKKKITKELRKNNYDAIIHAAAVSDYKLKRAYKGKISSGKKELNLKLIPAEKIIKMMRRLAKDALFIQFKLEVKPSQLIERAYRSLKENNSDFVVANSLDDLRLGYKGYLVDKEKQIKALPSKKALADALIKIVASPF